MISRRAQLKSQDQKASSSLTDDFTMRNFIAVSHLQLLFSPFPFQYIPRLFFLFQNPSFMQETVYEPLILNIPLLGGAAGAEDIARNTETTSSSDDAIVVVESDPPLQEPQVPTTGEQPLLKKRRTIRFAE
jgi:hypothetical protein